ncbi:PH domain-containing protein [Paenibacillus roseipurpureus]|uniref:PH domain-containing protein n=1 Tax=Paenibacillus roseopurpureus TaxID=2918901 RepID=A0AA96RL61_9BACL|nr:PH domain-containing protein [Paenibacillus sp. MBLB1832]WNR47118.1 PH domain-containing protein [Paenibacillus sp. MBLB1832]
MISLGIFSGLLGNLSEVSVEELSAQYGSYLMSNETITTGFKLVRDTFVVTDERIIIIDHQGVTGKKTKVSTIDLDSIYEVSMETGGTGFDDSELTIHYITSPYYRANTISTATYRFEFKKKFNIQSFYVALQTAATQNRKRING